MMRTALAFGHGRSATASTAFWDSDDASIASRILISPPHAASPRSDIFIGGRSACRQAARGQYDSCQTFQAVSRPGRPRVLISSAMPDSGAPKFDTLRLRPMTIDDF